jgi:uncharacterized membrane protein
MPRQPLPSWTLFLIVWTGMCLVPVVGSILVAIALTPSPERCGEGCGMAWIIPSFVIYVAVPIWFVVAIVGVWLSRRRLPPGG